MINTVSIASLLWRRKKTILFCGVAFAGLSFGASRILPMQYTSEGSLIVDDRPLAATTGGSQGGNTDILTEEDVLMSSGLILRTVQAYNLTHLPDLIPKVATANSGHRYLIEQLRLACADVAFDERYPSWGQRDR